MKKLNIVLFGTGNVGSALINQILKARTHLREQEGVELHIPVIANSNTAFFQKELKKASWETDFKTFGFPYRLEDVLEYVEAQGFENLVAVDATDSEEFVAHYEDLVWAGFHLVAANKAANILSTGFYDQLRATLERHNKWFFYDTNVGGGLPVLETLRNFRRSQEEITRIRGVFSGCLSYVFNTFCDEDKTFSEILSQASKKGFIGTDPRPELSGKDVGRKLLILGRELGLKKELRDVRVADLLPDHLNLRIPKEQFERKKKDLDKTFHKLKKQLQEDEVIRHVGELNMETGMLEVKLSTEKRSSALGSLNNADTSVEIFTRSSGSRPIVLRGAGVGAALTARGVLTDLIKLAEKLST